MKLTTGGGSPIPAGECCCCKNCCNKFCGDEYVVNGNDQGFNLGVLGDMTWYVEPNSTSIVLSENPDPPFCGVRFNFTVRITDAILGTECTGVPATMWLCRQDHRPSQENCWCVCHWHIEIDACESETEVCNADGCLWEFDAGLNDWVSLRDCEGDCQCLKPEVAGGEQQGDIDSTTCNRKDFPEMRYTGGDDCTEADCNAPNCGDCGSFDMAAIWIIDPDYSVRCCCLGNAYDVGGV